MSKIWFHRLKHWWASLKSQLSIACYAQIPTSSELWNDGSPYLNVIIRCAINQTKMFMFERLSWSRSPWGDLTYLCALFRRCRRRRSAYSSSANATANVRRRTERLEKSFDRFWGWAFVVTICWVLCCEGVATEGVWNLLLLRQGISYINMTTITVGCCEQC